MNPRPIRIGVGGSHSTGKTTFLNSLGERLKGLNLRVNRVQDLAKNARDLGFSILTEHTYESTLWIMAEGLRREAEATLLSDVILIDRPVFDALGYYEAALEISGREADQRELEELRGIAVAHLGAYNLVIGTELDPTVKVGKGRDLNKKFRQAAASQIRAFLSERAPSALTLSTANVNQSLDHAMSVIKTHFSLEFRTKN